MGELFSLSHHHHIALHMPVQWQYCDPILWKHCHAVVPESRICVDSQ